MKLWVRLTMLLIAAVLVRSSSGQTPATNASTTPRSAPVSFALRTLGSEQLWSDELVYGRWRIQRNEFTGSYRLLDPSDVRRASGTGEQCRAAFTELKRAEKVPLLAGRAVITLHGFGRSRNHMAEIGEYLEKQGDFLWINVSYASTRRSIDDHAASLARVIDGLEGIDEVYFVAHSLGNLVVRRYLGEVAQPEPRWKPDPRIKRMVMLGPPNKGARLAQVIAELLNDNELARFIAGPSAWQLARQWDDARKLLSTPSFEFGILAGGCGDNLGLNPLVTGDDDLVVAVEETRLPGAADFRVVNCRHGQLMYDSAVQQYVLNFLEHGYFSTADERQPIAIAAAALPAPATEP